MSFYLAHLHAQDVASRAFAAGWIEADTRRSHLVSEARENLVKLLAGEPAGTGQEACREVLIDLIAMSILGSNDLDCTPESQAEAVLEDILNNCLPLAAKASS